MKTEGISWKSGHICCEHWSEGIKKDNNDLPNLTVPSTQIPIIENKHQKVKGSYGKLKLPTNTDKLKLKELKRNLDIAKLYKMPTYTSTNRKEPTSRRTSSTLKKCKQTPSNHTNKYLQDQLDGANEYIKRLIAMPQLEQSSLQPPTDLHHRHLLQTTSYNHLLLLHLLISRKRKHNQQQARNPP